MNECVRVQMTREPTRERDALGIELEAVLLSVMSLPAAFSFLKPPLPTCTHASGESYYDVVSAAASSAWHTDSRCHSAVHA